MSGSISTREYIVTGMSCGGCVASVREEVAEVAGVGAVDIELATGRLVVTGDVTDEAVRGAVAAAGYAVVS